MQHLINRFLGEHYPLSPESLAQHVQNTPFEQLHVRLDLYRPSISVLYFTHYLSAIGSTFLLDIHSSCETGLRLFNMDKKKIDYSAFLCVCVCLCIHLENV